MSDVDQLRAAVARVEALCDDAESGRYTRLLRPRDVRDALAGFTREAKK